MSSSNSEREQLMIRRIQAVMDCKGTAFADILRAACIDPKRGLRFRNLSGLSFAGQDLRGMDFTGANLIGCDFSGALIDGARFDRARLARVGTSGRNRAVLERASDWSSYAKGWQQTLLRDDVYDDHLPAGVVFQDAPFLPEMVVLPSLNLVEGSQRQRIAISFGVTTEEEMNFYLHGFREDFWRALSNIEDDRSKYSKATWKNVAGYADWASQQTGFTYRLITEREWEAVCANSFVQRGFAPPDQIKFSATVPLSGVFVDSNAFDHEWCRREIDDAAIQRTGNEERVRRDGEKRDVFRIARELRVGMPSR